MLRFTKESKEIKDPMEHKASAFPSAVLCPLPGPCVGVLVVPGSAPDPVGVGPCVGVLVVPGRVPALAAVLFAIWTPPPPL